MSWILAAPLLIPFAAAVAAWLSGPRAAPAIAITGCAAQTGAALLLAATVWQEGTLSAGMGGWAAPVGIALVADMLSAIMVVVTAFMGLAVAIYALADIRGRTTEAGWHPLFQLLLAGATGAFLTGDLFNLYVWFEVMLIASFGLLTLGGSRAEVDAGVKYVALNLIATLAFLTAVGLLYGLTGTLTMADMALRLETLPDGTADAVSLLLLGAFAAKAGLFPVFFWLPAAYHAPPTAVTAIFAAILTKVGAYAILRVFPLLFPDGPAFDVLLPLAILTMIVGVIGAAAQTEVHRILSFHIVSQIGYIALGIALASPLALMGAVLYMVHNIVVKANLILISGVARRLTGSHDLGRAGGLYLAAPGLSLLFLIAAAAMAGLPPFSGFWGKLALVQAGAAEANWIAVAATLGVGLFTLYSMTKIWLGGYLAPRAVGQARPLSALPEGAAPALVWPIVGLTLFSLAMGLWPEPFLALAERAATDVLARDAYIAAVLGEHVLEVAK